MNSLTLRAQRKDIVSAMREIMGSTKPADQARWKDLDAQQQRLLTQIQEGEVNRLETELSTVRNAERPNINIDHLSLDRSTPQGAAMGAMGDLDEARSTPEVQRAFSGFLRDGKPRPELRALGVGGSGGDLVPIGFQRELETKLKYYAGLRNICRIIKTATGAPLNWPTWDDTAVSGNFLNEAAPITEADPTISQIVVGSYMVSSQSVLISVQEIQDAAFSLEAELSTAFAARVGRILDQAYLLGNGSNYPITGLIPALQTAGGREVLAVGSNTNDGVGTDLNSVGTDDFSALINALDYAYQKPTNSFVFNQLTLNKLRQLKDKYGRPVWQTSLAEGEPDKIFGFRFQVDNAMANIGAGNISVLFGDPDKFIIRDALGITMVRYNELYMPNHQIGFEAYMRTDAKLLQPAAWAYLQHSLS